MKDVSVIFGYIILCGFYQLPEYLLNQTGSLEVFFGLMALFVYRLTNDVLHTEDTSGFSSTWILAGLILLMTVFLPMLITRLRLNSYKTLV